MTEFEVEITITIHGWGALTKNLKVTAYTLEQAYALGREILQESIKKMKV